MNLYIHTDASFLSEPNAKSRAGGYFFLSSKCSDPTKATHNAPIHVLCQILKNVLASASEAELSAMFENAQMGAIIRAILWDLGHIQPPTPIRTDNTTAAGIVHDTFKQVRSRTVDMRFHWLKDRYNLGQFYIYWDKGEGNLGDYYTKNHPPWHQFKMRPIVLNNPLDTKYYSSKGVLVTSRRRPVRPVKITANRPTRITVDQLRKTVIDQSNKWREYLNKIRTFTDLNRFSKQLI